MQQLITIYGFYNDTKESIKKLCMVDSRMNPHHKNHSAFIKSLESDDSEIFYYYEPDEHILGDKGDFHVYKFTIEGIKP